VLAIVATKTPSIPRGVLAADAAFEYGTVPNVNPKYPPRLSPRLAKLAAALPVPITLSLTEPEYRPDRFRLP